MKTKLIALSLLAVPILAAPSLASTRVVQCSVAIEHREYSGPCAFTSLRGGSFTLENRYDADRPLVGRITRIDVDIVAPGVAEVTVFTNDGKYRWSQARRSVVDPACWVGADYTICARG